MRGMAIARTSLQFPTSSGKLRSVSTSPKWSLATDIVCDHTLGYNAIGNRRVATKEIGIDNPPRGRIRDECPTG